MYNMIQSAKTTCDGRWDVGGSREALGSANPEHGLQGRRGHKALLGEQPEGLCRAPECRRKVWFQSPAAAEKQLAVVSR